MAEHLTSQCDDDMLVEMKKCNKYGLDDTINLRNNRDDCMEGMIFGTPEPCPLCGDPNSRYR